MQIKIQIIKSILIFLGIMCFLTLGTSVIYLNTPQDIGIIVGAGIDTAGTPSDGQPSNSSSDSASAAPSGEKDQQTPGAVTQNPSVTLSAVGDLMMHQGNLNHAYDSKTGNYDFSGFLEYVTPYLTAADLTIGNLETVTAGPKHGYTSFPRFNTPDALLTALSGAGFDILSTANNHCLDRGLEGLLRTIKQIHENKMINIGSSADGTGKHVTKEINGIKISILSYTYAFNGMDAPLTAAQKSKHLSKINEDVIKSDIESVKQSGTDAVIVFIHWGDEYKREPNTFQTSLAKKIFAWGADIILGSHPHVIQKSEVVQVDGKDKFIIYSMGNFISGYRRTDTAKRANKIFTEDGVIVQIKIEKAPGGGIDIKTVDYIPTWVDKYHLNHRPVFKIIPIPQPDIKAAYVTDANRNHIRQSYQNTMDLMTVKLESK